MARKPKLGLPLQTLRNAPGNHARTDTAWADKLAAFVGEDVVGAGREARVARLNLAPIALVPVWLNYTKSRKCLHESDSSGISLDK